MLCVYTTKTIFAELEKRKILKFMYAHRRPQDAEETAREASIILKTKPVCRAVVRRRDQKEPVTSTEAHENQSNTRGLQAAHLQPTNAQ